MKKCLYFVMVLLVQQVNAQRVEIGFQGGVCNYWGELAPTVQMKETHATGGLFARINFNHTWAMKGEINHYTVSGHDANFDFNKVRNLSFQSDINEAALLVEFNYLKYGTHVLHEKFTSYVYCGIAGFTYNPKTLLNNTWYVLSDYRTENVAYSKFSMAIPFGIGIKYMFNNKLALESQLGFRKTYTDYLDDASSVYPDVQGRFNDGGVGAVLTDRSAELFGTPQFKQGYKRGDPNYKDWYMSFTVGLSFRLNTKSKCPRFF